MTDINIKNQENIEGVSFFGLIGIFITYKFVILSIVSLFILFGAIYSFIIKSENYQTNVVLYPKNNYFEFSSIKENQNSIDNSIRLIKEELSTLVADISTVSQAGYISTISQTSGFDYLDGAFTFDLFYSQIKNDTFFFKILNEFNNLNPNVSVKRIYPDRDDMFQISDGIEIQFISNSKNNIENFINYYLETINKNSKDTFKDYLLDYENNANKQFEYFKNVLPRYFETFKLLKKIENENELKRLKNEHATAKALNFEIPFSWLNFPDESKFTIDINLDDYDTEDLTFTSGTILIEQKIKYLSQNEHLDAIFIERDNYITRLIENLGLAVIDMKQTINTQEFFSEEDSSFINYDKYYRIENLGRNAPLTIIIFGLVGFFMAIICSIILFIYNNQITQIKRTQFK